MDQNEAKAKYEQANELYRAGKHAKALTLLKELSATFPQHKDILFAEAQCLQKLGRRDELCLVIGQLQALGDPRADALKDTLSASEAIPGKKGLQLTTRQVAWGIAVLLVFAVICFAVGVLLPKNEAPQLPNAGNSARTTASFTETSSAAEPDVTALPQLDNLATPDQESTPPETEEAENSKWPGLNLPSDFHGTRVGIEIDPADFDPANFDVEKEAARIEHEIRQGKGVPPVLLESDPYHALWKRETYQPIIDAVREARLKHGNPYKGEDVSLPETEGVEATGPDGARKMLKIRYVAGDPIDDLDWGDDEDVIYVTGTTVVSPEETLRVYPGTLVIVAAQMDSWEGTFRTPQDTRQFKHAVASRGATNVPGTSGPGNSVTLGIVVQGTMLAHGNEKAPIVFCSDASRDDVTPFDWSSLSFAHGLLEYAAVFDSEAVNQGYDEGDLTTIVARCVSTNHLVQDLCGPGYALANYLGDSYYETIFTGEKRHHTWRNVIKWNIFDSNWGSGCGAGTDATRELIIEHNTFFSHGATSLTGESYRADFPERSIRFNNFLKGKKWRFAGQYEFALFEGGSTPIDAQQNYWGVGKASDILELIRPPSGKPELVDISNPFSKPVPMPFLTGIPEVDAVYEGPFEAPEEEASTKNSTEAFANGEQKERGVSPHGPSENPKWPALGLPPDFQGTRVGIDSSEYLTDEPFELDKEVERILAEVRAGKGVPPVLLEDNPYHRLWFRDTYKPVIDAAREAFHKHQDPVTGAPGKLRETITVPGNITGKDTLVIHYQGNDHDPEHLTYGDDEDIVYFTGIGDNANHGGPVQILPGTLLLAATMQDATKGGIAPQELQDFLRSTYYRDIGHISSVYEACWGENEKYFLSIAFEGTVIAKGKIDAPIVCFSDSADPKPFDYKNVVTGGGGVIDFAVFEDCNLADLNGEDMITARCKFDHHLESGRNGPGYVIASYFGNFENEAICNEVGNKTIVMYNIFNNRIGGGVGYGGTPETKIEFNTFLGESILGAFTSKQAFKEFSVANNNIFAIEEVLGNVSIHHMLPVDVDLSCNYWGTTDRTKIQLRMKEEGDNAGKVLFEPFLTSPVPMPFLTGIPEVDAVYEGPMRN